MTEPLNYNSHSMNKRIKNIYFLFMLFAMAAPPIAGAQSMTMDIPINRKTQAGDRVFTGYARGTLIPFNGRNADLPVNHSASKDLTGRNYYMVKDGEWKYFQVFIAPRGEDEKTVYNLKATYTFKNGKLHGPFKVLDTWGKTIFNGTCRNGTYEHIYYTGYHDDMLTKKIYGEIVGLSGDLTAEHGGEEIFHINDVIRMNEYAFGAFTPLGENDIIVTGQWTTWWEDGLEATRFDFNTGIAKPVHAKHMDDFPYYKKNQRVVDYYGSGDRFLSIPYRQLKDDEKIFLVEAAHLNYQSSFLRTGPWEYYRLNGQKKVLLEKTHYNWKTNKPEGSSIAYYDNGSKKNELLYSNGKLNGRAMYFHENGIMSAAGNYKEGNKTGFWKYFNAENKLSQEENFDDKGNLEGEYKFYFINGQLKEKGNYVNGKLEGLVTFYHPDGKLSGGNYFKNGKFTMPADYFDATGKSILSSGTGFQLYYHVNGKVSYKARFRNFCRDGLAEWYYDNGQLQQAAVYKYDERQKPDGLRWEVVSSYTKSGEKRNAGNLKNGNGTWISYDEKGSASSTIYQNGLKVETK